MEYKTDNRKNKRHIIRGSLIALLYVLINSLSTFYFLMIGLGDVISHYIFPINAITSTLVTLFFSKKTVTSFILTYISMTIIAGLLSGVFGLLILGLELIPIVATCGGVIALKEAYKAYLKLTSES